MDLLRKFFPFAFANKKDLAALIINVLIQLVITVVIGFVITIAAKIPVVNLVTGLVGCLVDLYFLASIVLSFLDYFKILK